MNKKIFIGKTIIGLIVTVIIGALLGTLLMTVAFMIPINQDRFKETFITMEEQASYHNVLDMRNCSYFYSDLPGVLDTATDALMLRTALIDSEGSDLYQAMEMQGFSYYWHGYVVILRMLNVLFNYSQMRFVNFCLQFILVFLFALHLNKIKGIRYSLLFLTSYLLLMPVALFFCLQYSWIFYIAIGASFLLVKNGDFFEQKHRYLYFFVVVGIATSFFDLLTYPLVSWAFPILWWMLCTQKGRSAMENLGLVVRSGFAWIWGYAGMWISKCLIASVVLKRDILKTAIDEMFLRVGVEDYVTWSLRLDAIEKNWVHYKDKVYMLVLIGWMCWFLFKIFTSKIKQDTRYWSFALVGISPLVWYCVLTNHTLIHQFFTYRIFNISVLAILAGMVTMAEGVKEENSRNVRDCVTRVLAVGLVCIVAFIGTCFSREKVTEDNSYCHYREEITVEEGQTLSMTFVPLKSHIVEFGVQFQPLSKEGQIEFSLLDGERLIEKRVLPFSVFDEELLYYFNVDWRLKLKEYTVEMKVCGDDATGKVFLGYGGPDLLAGSGMAELNGQEQIGQLYLGTVYSFCAPPVNKDGIYIYLTWMFALLPAYVLFEKIRLPRKSKIGN